MVAAGPKYNRKSRADPSKRPLFVRKSRADPDKRPLYVRKSRADPDKHPLYVRKSRADPDKRVENPYVRKSRADPDKHPLYVRKLDRHTGLQDNPLRNFTVGSDRSRKIVKRGVVDDARVRTRIRTYGMKSACTTNYHVVARTPTDDQDEPPDGDMSHNGDGEQNNNETATVSDDELGPIRFAPGIPLMSDDSDGDDDFPHAIPGALRRLDRIVLFAAMKTICQLSEKQMESSLVTCNAALPAQFAVEPAELKRYFEYVQKRHETLLSEF